MKTISRDYNSGDEYRILDLFKQVFEREMSLNFWKWRFVNNPFGKAIIKLSFDRDILIGHYAVIPMDVQVRGETIKAVFSMTTMTHPEYSGKGIFTCLAEENYQLCQDKGFRFVYGFPNRNSHSGFVRKLKWQDLGKLTILEKTLQPGTERRPVRTGFLIKETERFESAVNLLWDKVKQNYNIIVPRTEQFLNWRFVENPDVSYKNYTASDSHGNMLGYFVLKTYAQDNITKGHIVDMLSLPEAQVIRSLLETSYDFFLKQGIRNISCWLPQNTFYADLLREEGFVRKETDTYFGIRSFSQDNVLTENIGQLAAWYITMGDSDVF